MTDDNSYDDQGVTVETADGDTSAQIEAGLDGAGDGIDGDWNIVTGNEQ